MAKMIYKVNYVKIDNKNLFAHDSMRGVTLRFVREKWEMSPCPIHVVRECFRTFDITESEAMQITNGITVDKAFKDYDAVMNGPAK